LSTIITFGYTNAPQGQPGANAIAYCLLDDGEQWSSSDPNYTLATSTDMLVADRSGNVAQGPLAGTVGYLAPSVGNPWTVTLSGRYWPISVGSGFFREGLPYCATGSIRVSAAEAVVLKRAGALATW
jgi:hypothetical protein